MIRVTNVDHILVEIKREILLPTNKLTLLYIKKDFVKDNLFNEIIINGKIEVVTGSEFDFYDLASSLEEHSVKKLFLIFTLDEFENYDELINSIQRLICEGGEVYISYIKENISAYSAKHYLDRITLNKKLLKTIKKKYVKYLAKTYYYQIFNVEPPLKLNERFNLYFYILFFRKYKIKKFIDATSITKLFYKSGFRIDFFDSDVEILKFRKNY